MGSDIRSTRRRRVRRGLGALTLVAAAALGTVSPTAALAASDTAPSLDWRGLETGLHGEDLNVMYPVGPNEVWIGAGSVAEDAPEDKSTVLRCSTMACESIEVPAMGAINGFSGTSADMWVAADNGVMRRHDGQWTTFGAEAGLKYVSAVKAIAADDVWIAQDGEWTGNSWKTKPKATHWNGHAWQTFDLDGVFIGWIDTIEASASDNVWFGGGHYDNKVFGRRPGAFRWDGEKMTKMLVSNMAMHDINSSVISMVVNSPTDVWLGGGHHSAVLRHWDGVTWRILDPENTVNMPDHRMGLWSIRQLIPGADGVDYLGVGGLYDEKDKFTGSAIATGKHNGETSTVLDRHDDRDERSYVAVAAAGDGLWRTTEDSSSVLWASTR